MPIDRRVEKVLTRISDCLNFSRRTRNQRTRGFTLVEILVVLMLITMLAGLVVVSMPSFTQSADFDQEARRLQLLLQMAKTEAVLDSVEYGFAANDEGYEFFLYSDAERKWIRASSPLQARTLTDDIRLRVRTDSGSLRLAGSGIPPVLILSSGETTPFEIDLEYRPGRLVQTLTTDGYGDIVWASDE